MHNENIILAKIVKLPPPLSEFHFWSALCLILSLFKVWKIAGFRPRRRACCLARPEGRNLCCGAKDPKPLSPGRNLFATEPNYMAAQLAPLKQCSPDSRIRHCDSAAPNAREILKKQIKFSILGRGRPNPTKHNTHAWPQLHSRASKLSRAVSSEHQGSTLHNSPTPIPHSHFGLRIFNEITQIVWLWP